MYYACIPVFLSYSLSYPATVKTISEQLGSSESVVGPGGALCYISLILTTVDTFRQHVFFFFW